MRVLQVIGGSVFGGGTRVILALCQHLRAQGFEVIFNGSDSNNIELFRKSGCEIFSLPNMRREIHPSHDLVWVMRLTRFIRQRQIDIVHTHTSKGGMIGRLAARLAKVPVVIHTVHGFAFHEFSSSLTVRVYSLLERIAARWCDCIVFVNEFHRQWALQLNIVAPAKTITIPNGIPASYPKSINRDKLREEFSISPSAKLIGSIGRLAAQKGLEYLIKAMPGIVARFPETYLILVGDGPLRRALEQLAIHLGLAGRIFFTGFRLDADVLCPEFDIVVLPSLREGLSIALLEAMRVGKPIVTTEIGSNLNVVSDQKDALLVQPANIRELENAVIQLLEEPYMGTRLGESARLTFKEHFTEDRMLASYYQIYLNLLAVRRDRLGADSFQNNIRKV